MSEFREEACAPIDDLVPADASALHKKFLAHWLALRGQRRMPAYKDLDPCNIPWALANIFVLEVLPEDDFVYRLAGDEHSQRYRRNLKGARIGDIMQSEGAAAILQRWRTARAMPAAYFLVTDHRSTQGSHVLGERMVLPFAGASGAPSHLVGVTDFVGQSRLADDLAGDQRVKFFRWARIE